MDIKHIKENQSSEILNVLVNHCTGAALTPQKIEEIHADIVKAMHEGPASWAFLPQRTKNSTK